MNSNDPATPTSPTGQRVLQTLHEQQRRLRWLTAAGITFWVLAIITSVGVLAGYWWLYAPKERQMFADYGAIGHLRVGANQTTASATGDERSANIEKALGIHFTMNYVVTKGLLAVAISVVVLSCATLATLLLVILNRRVTLRQINHRLAQISEQLKALQDRRGG